VIVRLTHLLTLLYDPMITAVVCACTATVPIWNCNDFTPAGTSTLGGGFAIDAFELARVMETPPAGAGPVRFTVPVPLTPPLTVDGLSVTDERAGGFTVTVAVFTIPAAEAVIVTEVDVATPAVVIVNDATLLPARTVTEAGTAATPGLLLESEITAPPVGAARSSAIVPFALLPPVTAVGLADSEVSEPGLIVSVAVLTTPA
jgi:hypothetical protein